MVFGVTLTPSLFAISANNFEASESSVLFASASSKKSKRSAATGPSQFEDEPAGGRRNATGMHVSPGRSLGPTPDEAAPLGETATVAVAIRVRPLSPSEQRSGAQVAWKHDEQKIWQTTNALGGRAYTPYTPYDFDRVYGAQTTTEQIHAESVSRSVARTLQGYHATILAYGQTSSGKTTTIRGGAGSDGLIPLSVRQVLKAVSTAQRADADAGGAARQWTLKMSYLEIYNETIGDLLTGQVGLPVFEKRDGAIHVQELREAPVTTWDELERLLVAGDERRHVACTLRNDESSRAHTIFRLSIRSVRGEPGGGATGGEGCRVTEAELNIVNHSFPNPNPYPVLPTLTLTLTLSLSRTQTQTLTPNLTLTLT